jgi:hypothetical protein
VLNENLGAAGEHDKNVNSPTRTSASHRIFGMNPKVFQNAT